jgi:hypothetical protein
VTAWQNETVKVYAVNPVGDGPTSSGSGTAWARSGTQLCVDSLSGDESVQDTDSPCHNSPGAWSSQRSNITWIDDWHNDHPSLAGTFEFLCTTYAGGVYSSDVYALINSPTGCPQALASLNQSPDVGHLIAAVSKTAAGSGSQHLCEYVGMTNNGTSPLGPHKAEELSPCGTRPGNLTSPAQGFNFWT